jgi:hypothetical protein
MRGQVGAGQYGLCKSVQDSVGYVSQYKTVWIMLDSAGQYGLCKTVQGSVGYVSQCRTVWVMYDSA